MYSCVYPFWKEAKVPNKGLSSSFEKCIRCAFTQPSKNHISLKLFFFLNDKGGFYSFNQRFVPSHLLSSWPAQQVMALVPTVGLLKDQAAALGYESWESGCVPVWWEGCEGSRGRGLTQNTKCLCLI